MKNKAFGSGYFGEWITDEFGLPAYRYTCDQSHDPKAVTPVNKDYRGPREHSHQVGNDRLVAIASNDGYVQVRQDEGSPKFLNDYDPARGHYAGGFGYLTDGQTMISTWYPGQAGSFERVFGCGYLRKTVRGERYTVDQVIFAPFGDDPVLISQVTVTNLQDAPADLRWIEYWGCRMYQFSYRAQILSATSRGKRRVVDLRHEAAGKFANDFTIAGKQAGLVNRKRFRGYSTGERLAWGITQALLATAGRGFTGGAIRRPVPQASLEDYTPPPTFLVSLDAPADGMSTDEQAFFGQGGPARPDGLARSLPDNRLGAQAGSALFLERRLELEPGESRTLFFAYGYLPEGFALDALIARYHKALPDVWAKSSVAWLGKRIRFEVPGEPWIDRELTWHNYYLRSNLTYDSFFREHILSQGHVYQYIIGFQGAARDPLQHALPFIYSQPQIVKEVLRYTLKEVLPDGEIPYGMTGQGMKMAAPFRPSDLELWLLWLASEYVLATRDLDFLVEQIPTYPLYGPKAGRETVGRLLERCCRHLARVTGTGKHGLMRLSNGDWNDGAVIGFVPKKQEEEVRKHGESVLNAAFASYVFDLYAQMLDYSGDAPLAGEARKLGEEQRQTVREQWCGEWFRRAWLSESLGWIGEDTLWLEPQPWAIIGGAATSEQQATLVGAIDRLLRQSSPIGARLLSQALPQTIIAPGELTNVGVWPSINGTLIWALAQVNGEMAWEEWKKNTLAYHAEAYPDVWYGIWSGPDVYNSTLSKYPGQTFFDEKILNGEAPGTVFGASVNWTDFPVCNMHPHAWPLYDIPRLLRVGFTPEGVTFAPCLPLDAYRFESPLLGFEKTAQGYSGWYAPARAGVWQISVRLQGNERVTRLEVNGKEHAIAFAADGALVWEGEGGAGKPLRWEIS